MTFDFLLALAASLGIHRIWNYETITATARDRLSRLPYPLGKVVGCPACNAFWIALLCCAPVTLLDQRPAAVDLVLWAFACYPPLRLSVWLVAQEGYAHSYINRFLVLNRPESSKPPEKSIVPALPAPAKTQEKAPEEGAKCTPCEQKKKDLQKRAEATRKYEKRVVIMTAFHALDPAYSLVSCVLDQARAIAMAQPNWYIEVWTLQTCKAGRWPENMPSNVMMHPVLPAVRNDSDLIDPNAVKLLKDVISRELVSLGNASVITHDLLFVSNFMNFAEAIHQLESLRGFSWWHVCHSAPGTRPENVATSPVGARYRLPEGAHKLVSLADSLTARLAAYYNVDQSRVVTVPNARDLLTVLGNTSNEVVSFVRKTQLHKAAYVQVYPISTTRMEAKGIDRLIRLFAAIYRAHQGERVVRLIIANPHANGFAVPSILEKIRAMADKHGLPRECLVFTSDHFVDKANGLSQHDLHTINRYANIFAFPTLSEASSLVLFEAALHGHAIVLNRDVPALLDVLDASQAWLISWGVTADHDPLMDEDVRQLASQIVGFLDTNPRERAKRRVLRDFGLDSLGARWAEVLSDPSMKPR